jgi:hypothetical protein
MAFESNVFINCPFDDDYKALLRPFIFTVLYFAFSLSYLRLNLRPISESTR